MLVWGTVTKPKSQPLTGVQYVSMHCVLILVSRLYHTEKDYTSEILKIARTNVKLSKIVCSTCSGPQMSNEATQSNALPSIGHTQEYNSSVYQLLKMIQ